MNTPLLILKDLQGNDPVSLTPLQQMIAPYTEHILGVLWLMWFSTLAYVSIRYVVIPLTKKFV